MATAPNPRERDRTRTRRERDHSRPRGETNHPRIVEERDVVDPYGGERHEVLDEYGRRFWNFRPMQRTRYDVWGFGWFWWLVFWLIIIGLIVWGWGWGWGY